MDLPYDLLEDIVRRALREDIGHGDLTTLATIPADAQAEAMFVCKEAGVVAGLPVVAAVYQTVDTSLVVMPQVRDGDAVEAGTTLARVRGGARGILTGERVALNFLQRMSGIATLTSRYVACVRDLPLPVRLLDTRKTTPGLRVLEKYAVVQGGGINHRAGLYDAVMLKDNHLAVLSACGCDMGEAVRRARAAVGPLVNIEVEVESVEQAYLAADAGADVILLDNMTAAAMREAVAAVGHRVVLEASGGITLETIRSVAETGVNYISTGALTHSARALDISLDMGNVSSG
jgi:nicotinate-nucleotide pyrophosphorylase (carboxylating)